MVLLFSIECPQTFLTDLARDKPPHGSGTHISTAFLQLGKNVSRSSIHKHIQRNFRVILKSTQNNFRFWILLQIYDRKTALSSCINSSLSIYLREWFWRLAKPLYNNHSDWLILLTIGRIERKISHTLRSHYIDRTYLDRTQTPPVPFVHTGIPTNSLTLMCMSCACESKANQANFNTVRNSRGLVSMELKFIHQLEYESGWDLVTRWLSLHEVESDHDWQQNWSSSVYHHHACLKFGHD
jgi:hypothetical protein